MANLDVSMSDLVKNMTLTVNVSGVRAWKVRLWFGIQMLKLAARVIGCGIKVDL